MKPALATDAQYLAAVKQGNTAKVQQMVDEAAKAAGYGIKGWHGTKKEFTSFNSNFNKESPFSNGKKPWFFSENEETASTYGSNINNYLLKLKNPLEIHEITGRDSDGEYQREAFMLENEYQALPENIRLLFEEAKNSDADTDFIVQEMLKSGNAVSDYRKAFKKWGKDNDGIIAYETLDTLGEEYIDNIFIVFDPSQIKLADPITYDKSGKVIPLSQRFDTGSEEITNPVVHSTDSDYLAAVKQGNTAKVQQMVDAAAKAAGYTVVGYHGAGNAPSFTVFKGESAAGWFSQKAGLALTRYGGRKKLIKAFLSFQNLLDLTKIKGFDADNILDAKYVYESAKLPAPLGAKYRYGKPIYETVHTQEFVSIAKAAGFDGIKMIENGNVTWGVFSPSQIKSADPVTYNKQGKVIPLSQRFDSSSEEITNPVVPENEGIPFFHTTTKITKLEDVDISKTSPNSYLGQALYGVLEGGSWKPSHLKSGRILRGTVSGRIIDLSNVTNEDLKRIGQLIGRNIETVPFLTLEKRFGDIGKGLRAAGYSAAIHLGPANTGKHIAIFDVSKIKSIGVDEITNPAGRIPAQFPYEYASYLKRHFPEIWKLGGNIRGNDAFRWWTAYRQGDRSPTVMHWWTVTRPAWIARHYRDHLIAGVVAQIKWGTIGRLGVEGMKRVVETKIRNAR